jgi:acetate kinase
LNYEESLRQIFEIIKAEKKEVLRRITAVGHRIVHGGEHFTQAVVVDKAVMEKIDALSHLAPLYVYVDFGGVHFANMRVLPSQRTVTIQTASRL